MSDISLHFTWWQITLWGLAEAFWPLTLITLGAAIWWWRRRQSWPARVTAIVCVTLWLGSAGTNLAVLADQARNQADYESQLRARQNTLAQSAIVNGIRLPAKTVVTHDSVDPNQLAAVDLPEATVIAGVPVTGHAGLSNGGLDGSITLAKDTRIGQAYCSAQTPTRFASGKLVECRLAQPSRIGGIPCTGDISLENGVVCTLSATYTRYGYAWRPGTKLTDYGDLVWFRIGTLAPSMRVFNAPLPADAEVQFNHGSIASVDLRTNPTHFRGCTFDLIMMERGKTVGRSTGTCSLPQAPGSLYIPLPATTIGSG